MKRMMMMVMELETTQTHFLKTKMKRLTLIQMESEIMKIQNQKIQMSAPLKT